MARMEAYGRRAILLACLALASPLVAGIGQAASGDAVDQDQPHLLVRIENEDTQQRAYNLDIEGPIKHEQDVSVEPGETLEIRVPAPQGDYTVALVQSTDLIVVRSGSYQIASINTTGCPGAGLVDFILLEGGGARQSRHGCIATPPRFTTLLQDAQQARQAEPDASIEIPPPGGEDTGRYRLWNELTAPSPDQGYLLTFQWAPGASFHDPWGRRLEGRELVYQRATAGEDGTALDILRHNTARYTYGDHTPIAYSQFRSLVSYDSPDRQIEQITYEVRYEDDPGDPECLIRHPLQGHTLGPDGPTYRVCGSGWEAGEIREHRGFRVLPLYRVASMDGQTRIERLLLADGLAYPLAYETFTDGGPTPALHEAYTLTRLNSTDPIQAEHTDLGAPPEPVKSPVDPLDGPSMTGVRDRFPLSLPEASQAARADPTLETLQGLLADEEAVLAGAALGRGEQQGDEAGSLAWWLVYTAPGQDPVTVLCQRAAATNRTADLPALERPSTPVASCDEDAGRPFWVDGLFSPPSIGRSDVPEQALTWSAAIDRWAILDPDSTDEPVTAATYRAWDPAGDEPRLIQVGQDIPHNAGNPAPRTGRIQGTGVGMDLMTGRTDHERITDRFTAGLLGVPQPLQATTSPAGPGDTLGEGSLPLVAGAAASVGLLALIVYLVTTHGGLAGLYTRLTKEEVLEHPTRQAIRDLVAEDPGIHANAITRQVETNDRTAEYHLDRLVREGMLTTLERGGYTHYFVPGEHGPREMQALASLKRGRAEEAFEAVRLDPGIGVTELADRIDVSKAYASKLVSNLVEAGLIDKVREGRRSKLYANELG